MRVGYEFAHEFTKHKVAEEGADEGEGHAEDAEQQVRHGQVEQEDVGDGAHALVLHQRQDHQRVAHHGQQEDEAVQGDLHAAGVPPGGGRARRQPRPRHAQVALEGVVERLHERRPRARRLRRRPVHAGAPTSGAAPMASVIKGAHQAQSIKAGKIICYIIQSEMKAREKTKFFIDLCQYQKRNQFKNIQYFVIKNFWRHFL